MELEYGLDNIEIAASEVFDAINGRSILAFTGDMGAGKTTFIHALCRKLGIKGVLGSPTFSIINEYEWHGKPVYHIDLYRCRDEEEAMRAGVEDCLFSGCLCFVEWPSKAPGLFPEDTIRIEINAVDGNTRKITVS